METINKLYCKQTRGLPYFLKQSKNPAMLLRWARHFILTMAINDSFLKNSICNDVEMLFPDFQLRLFSCLDYYQTKQPNDISGYFETYRSNQRQYTVYSSGASQVKSYGMHFFGLAADVINFKNHIPKWNLNYNILIKAFQDVGLYSLRPYEDCHVQFIPTSMQNDFRAFANHTIKITQDLLNCKVDGTLGKITQGAILLDIERLKIYFDEIDVENL